MTGRTLVMATAGHVDHGKSTLVQALTGVDPDRLAEEKRRGLTIDLGFAEMPLPDGATIAFVDVPGHARFIKNMLAGVGAIDAAMFVIDANEGWRMQSEEHSRILDLIGVAAGVVVLTKVAGMDPAELDKRRDEVTTALARSRLAAAPVLAVDALSGAGMDELRTALATVAAAASPPATDGRARLWVDRSFTIAGSGTVVTGGLTGGTLQRDQAVEVLGRSGCVEVRVRQLQCFGRDQEVAMPGSRVALNLARIDHRTVARGSAVVPPGRWQHADTFDAAVSVLDDAPGGLGRRGALALYLGSGEHVVPVRVLQTDTVPPGGHGFVRVRLQWPLPLTPGDRFVLRDLGRDRTIGGGEVLDVDPQQPAARARPVRSVDAVIAARGWIDPDHLERLTGERRPADLPGWVVHPARLELDRADLLARVSAAPPLGLDVALLDAHERAALDTLPEVALRHGRARLAGTGDDRRAELLAAFMVTPFSPPDPADLGITRAELQQLVREGLVVQRDGLTLAEEAVDRAAALVAELLARQPEGIPVTEIRQAMGTTRRWALAVLAELDARGVTRFDGQLRTAGPRCPAPE